MGMKQDELPDRYYEDAEQTMEEWREALEEREDDSSEKTDVEVIREIVKQANNWVPYQGPQGGEGWQNIETGDVVYDDEPPGESDFDSSQYHNADKEDLLSAVQSVTDETLGDEWQQMSADELRTAIQESATPEQLSQVVDELSPQSDDVETIPDSLADTVVSQLEDADDEYIQDVNELALNGDFDFSKPEHVAWILSNSGGFEGPIGSDVVEFVEDEFDVDADELSNVSRNSIGMYSISDTADMKPSPERIQGLRESDDPLERGDDSWYEAPEGVPDEEYRFEMTENGVKLDEEEINVDSSLFVEATSEDLSSQVMEFADVLEESEYPNSDVTEYHMDAQYKLVTEENIRSYGREFEDEFGVHPNESDVAEAWAKWAEPNNTSSMSEPETFPMHKAAQNVLGVTPPEEVREQDEFDTVDEESVRQAEFIMERTQDWARENFGDSVTLFRGVDGSIAREIDDSEGEIEYDPRGIESWSSDSGYAFDAAGPEGKILKAEVPVDKLVASSLVSPGRQSAYEQEFVLSADSIPVEEHK